MDRWTPEAMLELIDRHRVTTSHMVPTQLHRLLALPEEVRARYDCSSVRCMVHAAAPVPAGGEAADDRVVGRRRHGVLRRHRGRRHDRHGQGVARAAGHRRQGMGRSRRPHLRRRRQPAARRRGRDRVHVPRPGELRVQGRRDEDEGEPHPHRRRRRLLHRRRRRAARRGRLPVPARPQDRHDHLRRREHLSGRDRGRVAHPPEGRRRRRLRDPPPRLGRGGQGRRRAGRRRRGRTTRWPTSCGALRHASAWRRTSDPEPSTSSPRCPATRPASSTSASSATPTGKASSGQI